MRCRKPLTDGGSAELAAWPADVALPRDLLRAITRLLLDDNAGRMPDQIEDGLCDLFSTIDVNATRVKIGAPLPAGELTGERLRGWAKLQMLATQPEYSGKLRTYINNMQNAGEEDQAARNAFDMNAAKLAAQAEAYLKAGKFEAAPVNGKALNPNRDFIEKNLDKATVDALLAELDAKGKSFPPDSPRGLMAKNTLPALELAIRANPKWAEPHFKTAALESDPARKIAQLKMAATLAPRNAVYWQTLATSQAAANLFADAEKSWTAAERAAGNPEEKARIHQAKLNLEESRADFEAAEKRRQQDEEARDLQRVKDNAAAEIHAVEQAANQRMAANHGERQRRGAVVWRSHRPKSFRHAHARGMPQRRTVALDHPAGWFSHPPADSRSEAAYGGGRFGPSRVWLRRAEAGAKDRSPARWKSRRRSFRNDGRHPGGQVPVMASRLRWLVLSVFVLSTALNYLDRLLLAALAPTLKSEFHLSNTQYGGVISVFSIVYALMAPVAGWFIDRVGLNAGITVSMAVWSRRGWRRDGRDRSADCWRRAPCWGSAKRPGFRAPAKPTECICNRASWLSARR